MLTFALSIPLLLTLVLVQLGNALIFFGVKPNFVLAFLVAYAVAEHDWLRRTALILMSMLALNPSPYPNLHIIFVGLVFLAAAALIDTLKWQPLINGTLAVAAATLVINLESLRFGVLSIELIYNLILASLFYALLVWIKAKSDSHVFRRA